MAEIVSRPVAVTPSPSEIDFLASGPPPETLLGEAVEAQYRKLAFRSYFTQVFNSELVSRCIRNSSTDVKSPFRS